MEQRKIAKDAAIALYKSEWWKGRPAKEVALFQLTTIQLCMPFGEFHRVLGEALQRKVCDHELALNDEGLYRELIIGETERPSFEDILALLPPEKIVAIDLTRPTDE